MFETKEVTLEIFPSIQRRLPKGFEIVQNHLKLGDSYLINYTCETPIETNLSLEEIFYRSEAKYKVLLPENFTFFSPETFVEIKNQRFFTHPMKGTIEASVPNAIDELKTR